VSRRLVLDAGVLGQASHPRRNRDFAQWFAQILTTDTTVFVSEIADYEVRRELIRAERHVGITRLNALKATLPYLPLTTSIICCERLRCGHRPGDAGAPLPTQRSSTAM
jgi:hypothetical protein